MTEEVLSILRLLSPLNEPDSRSAELPPDGEKQLDAALAQLQNVARQLAIRKTKQVNVQPVCSKARCSYHITGLLFRVSVCACVFTFHIPGNETQRCHFEGNRERNIRVIFNQVAHSSVSLSIPAASTSLFHQRINPGAM